MHKTTMCTLRGSKWEGRRKCNCGSIRVSKKNISVAKYKPRTICKRGIFAQFECQFFFSSLGIWTHFHLMSNGYGHIYTESYILENIFQCNT